MNFEEIAKEALNSMDLTGDLTECFVRALRKVAEETREKAAKMMELDPHVRIDGKIRSLPPEFFVAFKEAAKAIRAMPLDGER